jgi:hypothetical protein
MASEQPLEPEVVRTWLAMWEQRDPFWTMLFATSKP